MIARILCKDGKFRRKSVSYRKDGFTWKGDDYEIEPDSVYTFGVLNRKGIDYIQGYRKPVIYSLKGGSSLGSVDNTINRGMAVSVLKSVIEYMPWFREIVLLLLGACILIGIFSYFRLGDVLDTVTVLVNQTGV